MSGEKTEDPTPSKLRKLREKGDVANSRELNKGAALIGALAVLVALTPSAVATLKTLMLYFLGPDRPEPIPGLLIAARVFIAYAMPVAGGGAVAAVALGATQTGMLFVPSRLLPDMKHFTPGQVWTQRFKMDALISGTIAMMAAIAGVIVGYGGLRMTVVTAPEVTEALMGTDQLARVLDAALKPLVAVGTAWVGIAMLLAIIDVSWQRHAHLKRNKMSLQEIKDEYKQSEGDPEHKARREAAHKELIATNVKKGVARADVVVRNPTHIAVGLRYRESEGDAPVITVTGRGVMAKAILREARRRQIPEATDKPIARALVNSPVDAEVPEDLFEAVAVIFRWLGELDADQD